MKNKSTLLILLSIFILFAFLQGVTALDDNSTNANSNEVLFADNNQIIQNSDEVSLDSETSLTYNDASSGSNIESSSKIPIADENGVLFNDKSDNIPMDHSPNHSSLRLQNDTVYYGNQAQYLLKDISGNPLANAKVTISINGMDYEKTTDNNGIAKLTIKLISNKKYNITASYKGDSQIPAMTSRNVLTVIPTITAEDVEKIFRNKTQYYPKLTDSNGKALKDTNVTMNINGVFYTKTTNDKGIATQNINLNPGKYIITSTNTATGESISNTIIVKANMDQNKELVKYFRNDTQYNIRALDEQGNPIAKQNVTFNINGVFYTKTTNDKGIATQTINLNPGKYIITSTNTATGESISNTILVKPNMDQNKNIVKYFKNDTQYSVRALDEQGNPLAKQNVTFNINGVFYTKTTNDEGIATQNINLNPGTYIITAMYKDCFVSNNITVLPTLTAHDLNKTFSESKEFVAKVVDGQGKELANQNVTFNINGVFYNKVTDVNGDAKLNIRLMAGEYIITSMYNGYATSNKVTVKA